MLQPQLLSMHPTAQHAGRNRAAREGLALWRVIQAVSGRPGRSGCPGSVHATCAANAQHAALQPCLPACFEACPSELPRCSHALMHPRRHAPMPRAPTKCPASPGGKRPPRVWAARRRRAPPPAAAPAAHSAAPAATADPCRRPLPAATTRQFTHGFCRRGAACARAKDV